MNIFDRLLGSRYGQPNDTLCTWRIERPITIVCNAWMWGATLGVGSWRLCINGQTFATRGKWGVKAFRVRPLSEWKGRHGATNKR